MTPLVHSPSELTDRSLQQRPDPDHPRAGAAARALHAATLADAALRRALELEGDDPLLEGWVDRITPLAIGEIPAYLLEVLPDFTDARLIYHMPKHFISDHREPFLEWLRLRGLPRDNPIPPSDGRRRPTKWPPEVKPTLENVMRDMAVLGRAASRWQTALYCSNDDIKDYFNHLAVATSELSKVGIILDRVDGSGPRRSGRCPRVRRGARRRAREVGKARA